MWGALSHKSEKSEKIWTKLILFIKVKVQTMTENHNMIHQIKVCLYVLFTQLVSGLMFRPPPSCGVGGLDHLLTAW